jgi:uncharacterized protein YecT (DUF1311 family)
MSRPACITAFALAAVFVSLSAPAAGPYPNTSTFGVPFSTDEDWYRQCMRVEHLPPAPTAGKATANCDPIGLYDRKRNQATTSQAEWDQVRACADARGDDAVLMMLYANGYGVPRDRDRAIQHACSLDFVAKAEMEGRVGHLVKGDAPGKAFDLCDDITSGYMGGVCTARREAQDSRIREARLERAARALPAASRTAFAKLRQAAERYAEAGARETDAHGTLASAFALQHHARLREQAMLAMLDIIAGKLQPASPEDYAARDRQLNEVYGRVMASPSAQADWPDRIGESTIAHADVRDSERLWLAYRDALVAFGASLPSAADANAVKALLTTQRIAELRDIETYR